MKTRLYPIILLLLTGLAVFFCSRPVFAQDNTAKYFPETGHTVRGEFFIKYQSVSDPIAVFGYPITDAFQDQDTGRQLQFFQRALFEYDSTAHQGAQITILPLGQELYQTGGIDELSIPFNITACRYFDETNKQVCFSFLDYFNQFGGIAQFGYPISNLSVQDNRIVQYFQYARLEWRPELPSGNRVVLSDLGRIYFEKNRYDTALLSPTTVSSNIPQRVMNLQINAFIARGEATNTRILYVIIKNQNQQPVPDITIDFALLMPDGSEKSFIMPLPTNQSGFTYTSFNIDQFPPNDLVNILVRVCYQGIIKEFHTAFWTR